MEANSPRLGFMLHDVARLFGKRFEQHAHPSSGLTRSQWQMLACLARSGGICQNALAELLEVEPTTLSRSAGMLERLGLIERRPHPTDRRIWILRLAPAAHPKLAQVRKLGDITRGEALAGVSEADRASLLRTLQVLKTNLTAACHSPVAKQERADSA